MTLYIPIWVAIPLAIAGYTYNIQAAELTFNIIYGILITIFALVSIILASIPFSDIKSLESKNPKVSGLSLQTVATYCSMGGFLVYYNANYLATATFVFLFASQAVIIKLNELIENSE